MSKRNSDVVQRTEKRMKLVPPDGGWGWMVLVGAGLSNIFNQSMVTLFSLLYGDALEAMGHETKGAAIVLSSMLFVSNFGGPIAGALIKVTSPRFIAVLGACFCTIGIFFSGFSTNIWHLFLTFGISYGLAMVGTGIGQTLMPHVVRYFLTNYGFKNACILLGSLSLHGICGTMLFQPVEWHLKKVEEEIIIDENMHLLEEKNDLKTKDCTGNGETLNKNVNQTELQTAADFNEKSDPKFLTLGYKPKNQNDVLINHKNNKDSELTNPKKTLWNRVYDLFDISLLSSPRFLNIIIGTALTIVSIHNFSMIFPLFLQKAASMDKHQTATCMSVLAMADIVGRLVLPMLQDKYQIKARIMLIMTSVWLIVVRQIMANQTELYVLLTLSALYGFGRSMVVVAKNITISEHCRSEQVPSAVGLGMLTMGIIVPPVGSFLGWIRDYTDSFTICITAQNLILLLFLVMWIPDLVYLNFKERQKKSKKYENSVS